MNVDTLLFDLDGTLTDPREGILGCIRYALQKHGWSNLPSDEEISWCIGPPLRSSYRRILNTEDDELVEQMVGFYRERYSTIGKFENRVYEGIPEALASLKGDNYRLLVCTAKPEVYSKQIIEHFGLRPFFDKVYGVDLDGKLDHKSDLMAHLLDSENMCPERCLMIGDRNHDILAARDNGMKSCGILWGYGSRDELELAGADFICENPSDLSASISAFLARQSC